MHAAISRSNQTLFALHSLLALCTVVFILLGSNAAHASGEIWVFEDLTGELTFQEVVENPQGFEKTTDTSRGMTNSVFWVRVDLQNDSNVPVNKVVSFDSISLPEVIEYSGNGGTSQTRSNGYAVPFTQRATPGIRIDFPHELGAASERQVFYRLESSYKVDIGFSVLNGSDFESQIHQATTKSLVVGAFLMLLLYNLFLAVTVRSKIYVIYSAFLASALIVAIGFFRYYEYFGFLIDPVWLEARTGILLYATAFWFLSNLFECEQQPAIKIIGRLYYLLVFAHIVWDPGTQFYVYAHFTGPIIFGVLTYTLLVAVRAGNPIAKFVALGWLVYIGFSLLFLGNLVGLLDAKFEHYLAYGNLIEAIVGSAVLSYRMRYIAETEERLKQVSVELARERLSSEIDHGYKWEVNVEKRLIRPDETFARWHGAGWKAAQWYPLSEVNECIPQNWHDDVAEEIDKVLQGSTADLGKIYVTRHPMVRADTGKEIWVQHQARVLSVEGQTLLVGVSQDVTELINAQDELKAAIERQRELFAIVGHELRTPVSTIKMLAEEPEISLVKRMGQIDDIAQGLLQVLDDMRVVVSPERALEYKPVSANPADVVERAVKNLSLLASERGLKLTCTIQSSRYLNCLINEQALRQLVTNLVKNAALHSGGTEISVELKFVDTLKGLEGILTVKDDGIGILPEDIASFSEPFRRGNGKQEGSGLGLFIVDQLTKKLSGELSYSDNPSGGSCFTLNFPLEQVAESSSTSIGPTNTVSLEGVRVLLAEDDNTLRMLTERILSKNGAIVTACVNGKAAFEAFNPDDYDLVITDLMMPEMDGHELTRAIRSTGAGTPIIAVTAAVIGAETEQFIKEGADSVLSKPLRPNTLIDELSKLGLGFQHRR